MVIFVSLALFSTGYSVEIKQDTLYFNMERVKGNVLPDKSVIIFSDSKAFHVGPSGDVLLQLGGRGNGPGEFERMSNAYAFDVSGSIFYYLFQDTSRKYSVFDGYGQLVLEGRYVDFLYSFNNVDGEYFALDLHSFFDQNFENTVVKVKINPDTFVPLKSSGFHELNPMVKNYGYNLKGIYVEQHGELLCVLDEMRPVIFVYSLDGELLFNKEIKLYNWVDPKPIDWDWPRKKVKEMVLEREYIKGFKVTNSKIYVLTQTPDPDGRKFTIQTFPCVLGSNDLKVDYENFHKQNIEIGENSVYMGRYSYGFVFLELFEGQQQDTYSLRYVELK